MSVPIQKDLPKIVIFVLKIMLDIILKDKKLLVKIFLNL